VFSFNIGHSIFVIGYYLKMLKIEVNANYCIPLQRLTLGIGYSTLHRNAYP